MARDPGRLGCAAESRLRDEPLVATASRVRRWLLIEQPGPWGSDALAESRLPEEVAAPLGERARRAGVRVVLIRHLDRDRTGPRRAYLVRSDRSHRWVERLDVDDPAGLLAVDLSVISGAEPPGVGRPGPDAVHLVCTNGRHDPCCADFGRPVVRTLRDSGCPEVWESSHIGGDRFAANLVILPSGVYYGRVPPEGAAELIRLHAEGRIDLEHYRGRSCYSPPVQAAEILLRAELGEHRLDSLVLVSAERSSTDEVRAVFAHGSAQVEVLVGRHRAAPALLTCSAGEPNHPWSYRLVDVQFRGPAGEP